MLKYSPCQQIPYLSCGSITDPLLFLDKTKRTMELLYFILLGAAAGWLAGQIMKGSGYGALTNIILGIVGALDGDRSFSAVCCENDFSFS